MERYIEYLTERTKPSMQDGLTLDSVIVIPWEFYDHRELNWHLENDHAVKPVTKTDRPYELIRKINYMIEEEKTKLDENDSSIIDKLLKNYKNGQLEFLPLPSLSFNDWARLLFENIISVQYNPFRNGIGCAAYTGHLKDKNYGRNLYMLRLQGCCGGNLSGGTDWDARLINMNISS